MAKSMGFKIFEERSNTIHGGKYRYFHDYVKGSVKVGIECPIHGKFFQTPYHHLRGEGCPSCGIEKNAERCRDTLEDFTKKASEVHGGKYDYSKVNYVNSHTKVTIVCPEHGEYVQTPVSHLQGHGCPKCGGEFRDKDTFIEDSKKIHGDIFDYSGVVYVNNKTKVEIRCKNCGNVFYQTPKDNLHGRGCPNCKKSRLEKEVELLLNEKEIRYEAQKRFDWLVNEVTGYSLTLDFYLPEYKVGIECQGEQHFKPVKAFGGKETHEKCVERDVLKSRLCCENGVKLLYFTNFRLDESLQQGIYTQENVFCDKETIYNKIRMFL